MAYETRRTEPACFSCTSGAIPLRRKSSCSSLSSSDTESSSSSSYSEEVSSSDIENDDSRCTEHASPDRATSSLPLSYHIKSYAIPDTSLEKPAIRTLPQSHTKHTMKEEYTITPCSSSDIRAAEHQMKLIYEADDMTHNELLKCFQKLNMKNDSTKIHCKIARIPTNSTQNPTYNDTIKAHGPPLPVNSPALPTSQTTDAGCNSSACTSRMSDAATGNTNITSTTTSAKSDSTASTSMPTGTFNFSTGTIAEADKIINDKLMELHGQQDTMIPWFYPCQEMELKQCQEEIHKYPIATLNGPYRDNEDNDTWLHVIVLHEQYGYLQALLERFKDENCLADAINKQNKHYQTALLTAVLSLNPCMVRTLITHGADPNIQGPKYTQNQEQRQHHMSPLQWAVKYVLDQPEKIMKCADQILKSPKLNINQLSNQGFSALHYAMELYKKAHGNNLSSKRQIKELIQCLLEKGADLNSKSNVTKDTPFHILIGSGDVSYISELLHKLPDTEQRKAAAQKNCIQNGCLHMAACLTPSDVTAGQLKTLMELLMSLGANPRDNNCENHKPAYYLHPSFKEEISKVLGRKN